jgi:hypothetical protein
MIPGANIYSLVTGMYPILSDDVKTDFSSNRSGQQSTQDAPIAYSVIKDNYATARQPYLQGNKIIFTSPENDDVGTISDSLEQGLLAEVQDDFATHTQQMMMEAQMAISGSLESRTAGQQAVINASGKSMEEMVQSGSIQFNRGEPSIADGGYGTIGGQGLDMYDPIRDVHINTTSQFITSRGHGIYGEGGKTLHGDIKTINSDYERGDITKSEKYDRIVAEGIAYFRGRAAESWNPIIRHARGLLGSNNIYRDNMKRMAKNTPRPSRRQVEMRTTVRDFSNKGFRAMSSLQGGMTNFASASARQMLKQHLGNPTALYNGGVMETYVIGPHTFGEFGPFIMNRSGSDEFEYRVDKISGGWFQNYFATSDSRNITSSTFDAERDARLRHAAWITKTHRVAADAAAIGGSGTVALSGITATAFRLYPEINLHNANQQFSDRIHAMVRSISDMDSLARDAPELLNLIRRHQEAYTNKFHNGKLGGTQVWASPYIGISGQQYSSINV